MSRKSLLLIAAAVISVPALVTSNAFALPSAAHRATPLTLHVSTFKSAGKVVAPRVVSSPKAFGQSVEKARAIGQKPTAGSTQGSNGGPFGQAVDKAKKIGEDAVKTANGNASASSGGPYGQAVDKAKKIGEDAAKAARDAAEAKAKLQTPAGAASQIPTPPPPPPPPPTPKGTPDGG